MKETNIEETNLYYPFLQIDLAIEKCTEEALLLIGNSKAGKSTAINWISEIPLIGRKEGRHVSYVVNHGFNNGIAKIGVGFQSCTLIPNICSNVFQRMNQSMCAIDTAGFLDNRLYIGEFGVAYAFKSLFEKLKKVQFLLVVPELCFEDMKLQNDLITTLDNFFSMFRMDELSKQMKMKLYQSTSLLFTKSKLPVEILITDLGAFIKLLRAKELRFTNRKYQQKDDYITCLENIFLKKRITQMKQAQQSKAPQPLSTFAGLLIDKRSRIDLRTDLTLKSNKIWNVSFDGIYSKLSRDDKVKLDKQIQMRRQSFKQFFKIINQAITPSLADLKFNSLQLDKKIFYGKVKSFCLKYNYYFNYRPKDSRIEGIQMQMPRKFMALEIILNLKSLVESDDPNLARIMEKIIAILYGLYPCNKEQAELLEYFRFIMMRGVRELSMIADVTALLNGYQRDIYDSMNSTFQYDNHLQLAYLRSFKPMLSESINFYSSKDIHKTTFQRYFNEVYTVIKFQNFAKKHFHQKDDHRTFNQLFRQLYILKAKAQYHTCKPENLVTTLKKVNQYLQLALECQYKLQWQLPLSQILAEKRRKIYMILSKVLSQQHKYELAIEVDRFYGNDNQVIQNYKSALSFYGSSGNQKQVRRLLERYAEHSYSIGQANKARWLLRKMISLEERGQERNRLKNKIIEYSDDIKPRQTHKAHLLTHNDMVKVTENSSLGLFKVVAPQLKLECLGKNASTSASTQSLSSKSLPQIYKGPQIKDKPKVEIMKKEQSKVQLNKTIEKK